MSRIGINKAQEGDFRLFENRRLLNDKEYSLGRTCIFVSHKKDDAGQAKDLAKYIIQCGVDVYFDENDPVLTNPDVFKDPIKITNAINRALSRSTHMICVISEKTKDSWWVPYEIGYVSNKLSFKSSDIGILIIKNISHLPEYLFLSTKIDTKLELDSFIKSASNTETLIPERAKTIAELLNHPLNSILR